MNEEGDSSSLASCTKGGRASYHRHYSDSEEDSVSLESCTKGGYTTSKKQSTLLSFVVNQNRDNDKLVQSTDDNSQSSICSMDHPITISEKDDGANSTALKQLKEKELCVMYELISVREEELLKLKVKKKTFYLTKHF